MTKEQIRTKFDRWAERVGHTPLENDLDNATLLLSYDDKQTSTTFSTVAVYAVAVHTDHVHVFLFSVQTVWQLDAQGDADKVLDERYRVISAIFVNLLCGFSMPLYGKGRVLCLSRRFARFFRIVRNFSVVYFAAVCYNE